MNLFIVSDIHGMFPQFQQMLKNWDQQSQLIILGDMIDRGLYSKEVVQHIMHLQEQHGDKVVVLKGNHEDMLGYVLAGKMPDMALFLDNGGAEFLQSFVPHYEELIEEEWVAELKENYPAELAFLQNARRFYQTGKLLITHAGFESAKDDWQETAPENFLWIRKHYEKENKTGLINIFGHTPVRDVHGKDDIWISPCGTYIDVDGGCAYGGQLNGLLISDDGQVLETYVVK